MVYLNRIYTRTGDRGETSLGDGNRVPKSHPRIVAYGGTDELNTIIGLALALTLDALPSSARDWLVQIQNDLFDLGADLCRPHTETEAEPPPLRVTAEQIQKLERWIDQVNDTLEPLTSFVLPGGTAAAAHLHHARAVCRRVEILVLKLAEREPVNEQVPIYLNRLSDLLFVLARAANDNGKQDVLWRPGAGR